MNYPVSQRKKNVQTSASSSALFAYFCCVYRKAKSCLLVKTRTRCINSTEANEK